MKEGQIRDAHELGMNSVVHSTLALAVSPRSISQINGNQRDGRLAFLVIYSEEELMDKLSSCSYDATFKVCHFRRFLG